MSVDFEEFAADKLPRLVRFAAAMCADRALAEDVVQEVLIRVHARWAEIGALEVPEAYVRRALVNEYLSWRRKWGRVVPRAELHDGATQPDPADRVAARSELTQQLAALPARQRAVLVLRYYEDLDDAAIAELLGCRPTTVRGYAARGLATLRIHGVDRRDEHAY